MVKFKSSYGVLQKAPDEEKKGIRFSIIFTYTGIVICIFILVTMLILNFINADLEDNAALATVVIAVVPIIAAIADVKKKDEQKETYIPKEQSALIILGIAIAVALLIISIFSSDWKDTIITVGWELLVSIFAGLGISLVK